MARRLAAAKLDVDHEEQIDKTMEFKTWTERCDAIMKALLTSMLKQATPEVKAVLEPKAKETP